MATFITMPKLGLTMTEGLVGKWHKKEGDPVEQGEIILEVSTDKISNEVEAPVSGVLRKILFPEGETVEVSVELAIIADADEDISNVIPRAVSNAGMEKIKEKTIVEQDYRGTIEKKDFIKASPLAKKYSREHSIDLALVKGTGPEGRIVEKDMLEFINNQNKKVKVSPVAKKLAADFEVDLETIDKDTRIMKQDVLEAKKLKSSHVEDKRITPNRMRKVIAERMSESWHIAPMVTLNIETDVTELKIFRDRLKDECTKNGIKLSYNDILIKICAKALMEYPMVNASFDGQEYIFHGNANIGLAVSLDGGLIVPNVKAAQTKSILEIAKETNELIDKARNNGLSVEEMTGGTFTISNLGMFGINTFTPIINQPEAAILGVNAMVDRPVVVAGEVVVRTIMNLSLTFDHRIIDGVDGAKFLAKIKELIENPLLLVL